MTESTRPRDPLVDVRRQTASTQEPFNTVKTAANLTPNIEQNVEVGGADRDRTGDPLLAKQVLSQLSYSPPKDGGPG